MEQKNPLWMALPTSPRVLAVGTPTIARRRNSTFSEKFLPVETKPLAVSQRRATGKNSLKDVLILLFGRGLLFRLLGLRQGY